MDKTLLAFTAHHYFHFPFIVYCYTSTSFPLFLFQKNSMCLHILFNAATSLPSILYSIRWFGFGLLFKYGLPFLVPHIFMEKIFILLLAFLFCYYSFEIGRACSIFSEIIRKFHKYWRYYSYVLIFKNYDNKAFFTSQA